MRFAVKGFNEGPLDAGYIDGEAMAATGDCGLAASHAGSWEPRLRSVKERLGWAVR